MTGNDNPFPYMPGDPVKGSDSEESKADEPVVVSPPATDDNPSGEGKRSRKS